MSKLQTIEAISSKSLNYIDNKYSKLTDNIQTQSVKVLTRMQQKEIKLQQKLQSIDTGKAKELFLQSEAKYQELKEKLNEPINKVVNNHYADYIPGIDSLQSMMKFLSLPHSNVTIPADKLQQIQSISIQVEQLQGRLQQANQVRDFIRERESQLKSALQNTTLGKDLIGINKEVYYYQEKLTQYKELLHDKKKLEEQVFATVRNLPAFKKFMEKYSMLTQLFPTPDNYGTPQALTSLQTRTQVQNILSQRIQSASAGTPQQYIQQQVQIIQSQLNNLKDKINKLGGGSSDMTMPDFKPNTQKNKTFLQRLQYGFSIQSEGKTTFLPVMSDIALTVGYKLSDNKSFGIGASYKVGWGHGFNNIHFSSEGVGLRSYMDIKLKGSIWMTGGFEYNYFQHFSSLDEIKNLNAWQQSALIGLTKKYSIGKRKEGNLQILYDFLASKQIPSASPIKFRVGWKF